MRTHVAGSVRHAPSGLCTGPSAKIHGGTSAGSAGGESVPLQPLLRSTIDVNMGGMTGQGRWLGDRPMLNPNEAGARAVEASTRMAGIANASSPVADSVDHHNNDDRRQ